MNRETCQVLLGTIIGRSLYDVGVNTLATVYTDDFLPLASSLVSAFVLLGNGWAELVKEDEIDRLEDIDPHVVMILSEKEELFYHVLNMTARGDISPDIFLHPLEPPTDKYEADVYTYRLNGSSLVLYKGGEPVFKYQVPLSLKDECNIDI